MLKILTFLRVSPMFPQPKERSPTWAKEIPIHGRGNVPVARKCINPPPSRNRTKRQNPAILTCLFSAPISHYPLPITHYSLLITHLSSLITHIPKYRNQISTLLGVSPLNVQLRLNTPFSLNVCKSPAMRRIGNRL